MEQQPTPAMPSTAPISRIRLIALDLLAFVLLATATGIAAGVALAGLTLLFAAPA